MAQAFESGKQAIRLTLCIALIAAPLWLVVRAASPAEPELASVFPFGGQQGSVFQAKIRGRSLDQVTAVWFDCEHLSATVSGVENDASAAGTSKKKKKSSAGSSGPTQLLLVNVRVSSGAPLGVHYMRVLTPFGISNAIPIRVHAEPGIPEEAGSHSEPGSAQPLSVLPTVINGSLPGGGELDYYSFEAQRGEILRFDALTAGSGLDPALTLFEPSGSWFRMDRLTELAFNDEEVSYPGLPLNARITYKFPKKGRYLIRVNAFLGEGTSDPGYQLSVRRGSADQLEANLMRPAHLPPPAADISWQERVWERPLQPDRLRALWSRAVASEGTIPEIAVIPMSDQPVSVTLPALLEGTIDRPARVDRVKFSVKAGDRIAVEVQTMRKTVPLFNPYLRIVSAGGDEAFTNVHSTVNTCGETILKQIQPKTTYSFPRDGEFLLEIRDITHAYGDSSFAYRVLLRQQIPHVGDVHVGEEQINLLAGEVTKMSVETDQEEGFDGQIALTVEGLPEGVHATMGTESRPHVPPPFNPGKVERFIPESQKATFLFLTDGSAAATSKPVEARIVAQPVMKGRLGRPLTVKKILVTVVKATTREAAK